MVHRADEHTYRSDSKSHNIFGTQHEQSLVVYKIKWKASEEYMYIEIDKVCPTANAKQSNSNKWCILQRFCHSVAYYSAVCICFSEQ